jgi:outer membrane murein-binding lipoprotein Lpp
MSDKAIGWIIKSCVGLLLLLIGAGVWYYTMGRKPHVFISAPVEADHTEPILHPIAPNEVLLLVGARVTLYDFALQKARWSTELKAPAPAAPIVMAAAPAAPAPKAIAKATPPPPPAAAPNAKAKATPKPDPLLAGRVKRRFAKLAKWSADLNAKRDKLSSDLQIEAFNVEAAKYKAELVAAQAEAGLLRPAAPPAPAVAAAPASTAAAIIAPAHLTLAAPEEADDSDSFDHYRSSRIQVTALAGSIWIGESHRISALDRADGHVLKTVTIPGEILSLEHGGEELFVVASLGQRHELQVTRLVLGNAPAQSLTVPAPPEPREEPSRQGVPRTPATPDRQVVFGANHSPLLQLDIRLVEKKLTERQTMTGGAGSDLEAADKKTTGGTGDDALLIVKALNREAERDATGGKEIIDESTYELTLRRPFTPTLPAASAQVHGHAELFSTATLDLVAAGKELVAFDHSNKKLWQAQLAQPITPITRPAFDDDGDSSRNHPCLEAGDRLYFFDSAVLTAFALQTGQPAWRVPLKGIQKVQLDDSGHLYASTRPGELNEPAQLLRIEAQTGRILWKLEKYDDCFVSGKDLYVTRETRNADDAVNQVFDSSKAVQCRWKLYKLSTRNGEPQWEWFQTRRPNRVEADHKRVSLLFPDELQILTSIAL